MRRTLITIVFLLVILPITVMATGGGLRKNSIKTCPNGVTYGMHSSKGKLHWHVAVTNGSNYYASGSAIYSDPCPNSSKNEGTAGSTSTSSKSTANNSSTTANNSIVDNNSYTIPSIDNSESVQKTIPSEETLQEKSKDNTLKSVVIDNEEIIVSDNMNYKTEKKHLAIQIEANDLKSKVEYENKDLIVGQNIINIIVTAENGDKKIYNLLIEKIKVKGTATIKKFVLGSGEVEFENNKATITKLKNENSLDYSYELSSNNAKLKIYLNEKETLKLDNLQENDKIKLVVYDENDNENTYEITIVDAPVSTSIMLYGITVVIILSIVIGIVVLIKKH